VSGSPTNRPVWTVFSPLAHYNQRDQWDRNEGPLREEHHGI
jgi:hypothetical protein